MNNVPPIRSAVGDELRLLIKNLMGDIIHQGGQYSLVNNVRGDNFWGGQYSLLHRLHFCPYYFVLSVFIRTIRKSCSTKVETRAPFPQQAYKSLHWTGMRIATACVCQCEYYIIILTRASNEGGNAQTALTSRSLPGVYLL